MSLIWADGFDDGLFGAVKYFYAAGPTSSTIVASPAGSGRNHGNVWQTGAPTAAVRVFGSDEEHATFVAGVAVRVQGGWGGSPGPVLALMSDLGLTEHMAIYAGATIWTLRRGGVTVASFTVSPTLGGGWFYIELKATLSDTVGSAEARVNGAVVATFSGDTKNAGTKTVFDGVKIATPLSAGNNMQMDDFYVCNGAGAYANDFLGDVVVEALRPNGNGSASDFLNSAGDSVNNYQKVDDPTLDTLDYVESGTSGQRDLYAMTNLSSGSGDILGVCVVGQANDTDATVKSVKAAVKSGASVGTTGARALTTTFSQPAGAFTLNPATGVPFTIAEINAIESGFEVA